MVGCSGLEGGPVPESGACGRLRTRDGGQLAASSVLVCFSLVGVSSGSDFTCEGPTLRYAEGSYGEQVRLLSNQFAPHRWCLRRRERERRADEPNLIVGHEEGAGFTRADAD